MRKILHRTVKENKTERNVEIQKRPINLNEIATSYSSS